MGWRGRYVSDWEGVASREGTVHWSQRQFFPFTLMHTVASSRYRTNAG